MAPVQIEVRRITPTEGALLRTTRLAAIVDSPGTYATTLAEAEARELLHWDAMAETSAAGRDQGTWFAHTGDEIVGMVNAYRTDDDRVHLTSLWSAPGFRAIGVAERLVDAATGWAVSIGARELQLWVVERNEFARRFYERIGFVATGQEMPYEPDPRLNLAEMTRALPAESSEAGSSRAGSS